MSDQPKPASGEVRPAIFDPEHYPEDRITQLEQQLAAERERLLDCDAAHEKGYEQGYASGWEACDNEAKVSAGKPHDWQYEMEQLQRHIERLEQQLADEREAHARKDAQLSQACKDHLACVQQLAAERVNNDAQTEAYVRRINDLREQLAEREKK